MEVLCNVRAWAQKSRDGWYRTHDIGRIIRDSGFLYLLVALLKGYYEQLREQADFETIVSRFDDDNWYAARVLALRAL